MRFILYWRRGIVQKRFCTYFHFPPVKLWEGNIFSHVCLSTILSLLAMIALWLSNHVHNAIMLTDTSDNALYNQVHWVIRTPYLSIKASNATGGSHTTITLDALDLTLQGPAPFPHTHRDPKIQGLPSIFTGTLPYRDPLTYSNLFIMKHIRLVCLLLQCFLVTIAIAIERSQKIPFQLTSTGAAI